MVEGVFRLWIRAQPLYTIRECRGWRCSDAGELTHLSDVTGVHWQDDSWGMWQTDVRADVQGTVHSHPTVQSPTVLLEGIGVTSLPAFHGSVLMSFHRHAHTSR